MDVMSASLTDCPLISTSLPLSEVTRAVMVLMALISGVRKMSVSEKGEWLGLGVEVAAACGSSVELDCLADIGCALDPVPVVVAMFC